MDGEEKFRLAEHPDDLEDENWEDEEEEDEDEPDETDEDDDDEDEEEEWEVGTVVGRSLGEVIVALG